MSDFGEQPDLELNEDGEWEPIDPEDRFDDSDEDDWDEDSWGGDSDDWDGNTNPGDDEDE